MDINIGFFDGGIGNQKMNILGADILTRFNLLFAKDRKYIYLRPRLNKNSEK
mgnify:CR=1 FL=1|tara:strand:+ start:55296 stop:55451 length:156 start_codon:yes stop_codon:yes gene_type:complete